MRFLLATALAVVVPVLSIGCGEEQGGGEMPPIEVSAAQPVVMEIVEWDEYTGRLDAIDEVDIRPRVSGYLQSVFIEEGKDVQRGDLLAIIDPRPFEAELAAAKARKAEAEAMIAQSEARIAQAGAERIDAQAQLLLADKQLARAKAAREKNAILQDEYDRANSAQLRAAASDEAAKANVKSAEASLAQANAAIATAQAAIETAALNLKYTQIRAPIKGRISRRYVSEGNLVGGGGPQSDVLTTIVKLSPIHVYFDANEREFLKYVRLAKSGARESSRDVKNPIALALVDETGYPHEGHMDFVDNRVDPNTGTMRGRAILKNEDGFLTPGLFAKVLLPGSGKYRAVLIPDSAVGSDQSEKFVYVTVPRSEYEGDIRSPGPPGTPPPPGDFVISRRKVTLGGLSHGLRIVRVGLDGSETIVTQGLQRVFEGVPVNTVEDKSVNAVKDPGLPENSDPLPESEWITRERTEIPEGVEQNAEPYSEKDPDTPRDEEQPATPDSATDPPNEAGADSEPPTGSEEDAETGGE